MSGRRDVTLHGSAGHLFNVGQGVCWLEIAFVFQTLMKSRLLSLCRDALPQRGLKCHCGIRIDFIGKLQTCSSEQQHCTLLRYQIHVKGNNSGIPLPAFTVSLHYLPKMSAFNRHMQQQNYHRYLKCNQQVCCHVTVT